MEKRKSESLYNLFWIFIFGCIAGWIVEGLYTLLTKHIFINHSAVVIGPFNMAYGFSACLLTFLLYKYRDKNVIVLFLIGFIGGSIAEYIMSWGMELVLGFTAWDYSHRFLNINGRICLLYSIFWGILAIAWIKLIYPLIIKLIDKMNYDFGKKFAIGLTIFLVFDILLTGYALFRANEKDKGIEPQNKMEEVLDKTFNKEYLTNMYNNKWRD